jgi:diguanylate cyclase (GGDEF)-like protein
MKRPKGTSLRPVWALTLLLAGVASALAFSAGGRPGPAAPPFEIPWWAFAPAVFAAEGLMFHVERKAQTHSFTLSEIPLVVGFFFTAPWGLIAGRLIGHLAYRVFVRRQPVIKLAFNLANFAAETAAAVFVFRVLGSYSNPLDERSWLIILLAVAVGDCISLASVSSVIRWTGGDPELGAVLVTGMLTAVVNTGLSILAVIVLWTSPWALGIVLLLILNFALIYRRHLALKQRHSSLQRIYGFSQLIGASLKARAVTEEVLAEARKLLRAASAEIVLLDDRSGECSYRLSSRDGSPADDLSDEFVPMLGAEPVWRRVVDEQVPVVIPRGSRNRGHLSYLARVGAADCMVAPLVSEGKVVGTIMVADRVSNVSTFDEADLQIFATVANHASVAFENGRLVDQLRKEAADRRHEALHDSLTGLPNRTLFAHRLGQMAESHRAGPKGVAGVMLIDLDRFKEVNDTLGHHNGDILLQQVALRLGTALRSCDTVARLGGDEFAILLPQQDGEDRVMKAAQRIVDVLQQPFQLEGLAVDVGASIGVALFPDHGNDATVLLQRADVAMYEAKGGEQRVVLYSPERDQNSPARLTLATQLRQAIAEDQLVVFYQPKARVHDGAITGVEALVRWRHPERGLMSPADFIGISEQTGLITPLTMFVLRTALRQCAEWSEAGHDIGVAVNLAVRSLLDTDLPNQIALLLEETGVPGHRLTLEITESGVMADPPRTIASLSRLATAGIRLSVDDFGTGYSSLSYLRRLPVNEVKVDRSFIFRIASDPTDAAIVRSIIELSHTLGLETVAEGVEDRVAWDRLRQMGCDEIQGFFLSKPLSAPSLGDWLDTLHDEATPVPLRLISNRVETAAASVVTPIPIRGGQAV